VPELDEPDAEAFELAGAVSPLVVDRLATTVLSTESTERESTVAAIDRDE